MYGYKKEIKLNFQNAIIKVKEALKTQGFGILTETDVKTTLNNKLNVNLDNYTILGFCNPPFAYKALMTEKEIGLMLPCNVIVFEEGKKVFISCVLPTKIMGTLGNNTLKEIAAEVEEKLKKGIDLIIK